MDKTELTIKTYDISASEFMDKFMDLKLYKNTLNEFVKYIKPGSKILDAGCGPGNIEKFLLEKDKTLRITGIDLSSEMIKLAKNNVPDADYEVKDIRKLNYPKNEFDTIICAFCLPYLYDEEALNFIKNISGFLKPDGYLYISTMEGHGNRLEKTSFSGNNEMFFNYYQEKFLLEAFKNNNLTIEKYFRQDYDETDGSKTVDMIFIFKKGK